MQSAGGSGAAARRERSDPFVFRGDVLVGVVRYVSRWFDRCGTALALLGSGSSASAAIWAPIFAAAEAQIGWRNTLSVWRNGTQAVTLSIQTAAVRRRDLMEPASDGRLIHSNEPNPVRAANGGFRGISCQIAMRR
jgi:hypothetical protein